VVGRRGSTDQPERRCRVGAVGTGETAVRKIPAGAALRIRITQRPDGGNRRRAGPYTRDWDADGSGGAAVLWERPTLLAIVLDSALEECLGRVPSVAEARLSMRGYRVRLRPLAGRRSLVRPFARCLNRELREARLDDSMDALEASGVLVLAPAARARSVAVIGDDAREPPLLAAARQCEDPEDVLNITFRVEDGEASFDHLTRDGERSHEPPPLVRCLLGSLDTHPGARLPARLISRAHSPIRTGMVSSLLSYLDSGRRWSTLMRMRR